MKPCCGENAASNGFVSLFSLAPLSLADKLYSNLSEKSQAYLSPSNRSCLEERYSIWSSLFKKTATCSKSGLVAMERFLGQSGYLGPFLSFLIYPVEDGYIDTLVVEVGEVLHFEFKFTQPFRHTLGQFSPFPGRHGVIEFSVVIVSFELDLAVVDVGLDEFVGWEGQLHLPESQCIVGALVLEAGLMVPDDSFEEWSD